jgi:hypothetical protein
LGFLGASERILMSKYEDLVSQGEGEVQRICDFVGSKYHPSMLEYYKNDTTVKNARRLKDWANLQRPLMGQNFNKYKSQLSEIEIQCIESLCRKEMEVLGYQLEFSDLTGDTDELEKAVLEMEKSYAPLEEGLSDQERAIRYRRLEVIHRILSRRLYQL